MTKLEKVIKGLACCTTIDVDGYPICDECPYFRDESCPDLDEMHTDALELLKEQLRSHEQSINDDWSGAQGNEKERIDAQIERSKWGIFG